MPWVPRSNYHTGEHHASFRKGYPDRITLEDIRVQEKGLQPDGSYVNPELRDINILQEIETSPEVALLDHPGIGSDEAGMETRSYNRDLRIEGESRGFLLGSH